MYVSVGHSFILPWTYTYNWLRDHTSWTSSGIGVKIKSILKNFWSLVLKFTTTRYILLFLYSEIYIVHIINCEWNRSVNFLLHMFCMRYKYVFFPSSTPLDLSSFMTFLYEGSAIFFFISPRSLSIVFSLFTSQTLSSLLKPSTHMIFGLFLSQITWYDLFISHSSCI